MSSFSTAGLCLNPISRRFRLFLLWKAVGLLVQKRCFAVLVSALKFPAGTGTSINRVARPSRSTFTITGALGFSTGLLAVGLGLSLSFFSGGADFAGSFGLSGS